MATTTPNIGLTKPVGTEFVNLGIINENYDKIDEAIGNLETEIENIDVNGMLKTIQYTASNITVNEGMPAVVNARDFGISDVEGYTPIAPAFFTSGSYGVFVTWLSATATDERTTMSLRNVTNAPITCSPQITILYVKSSFFAQNT